MKGKKSARIDVRGKVALVTGCNVGIGYETAKELNVVGAKVYMLCRSEERANAAREKLIQEGCDGSRLIFVHCELSKFASVRTCAAKIAELEDHIDILVNNAGLSMLPELQLTEDGYEMTWQCNYLGPFLLTELLLPLLQKAPSARIVIVSSVLHTQVSKLELSTINDKSAYGVFAPYNRSKLGNVMHARDLARRLREKGITTVTVNSLHPGAVATQIGRNGFLSRQPVKAIFSLIQKSEREGAQCSLYCALSTEVEGVSGAYFSDCKRKNESNAAKDDTACRELYEYSMKAVGLAK